MKKEVEERKESTGGTPVPLGEEGILGFVLLRRTHPGRGGVRVAGTLGALAGYDGVHG